MDPFDPFDPFDFLGDGIGGIAEWHWGNILTVTVASIAIIASVVVSAITLRRNASQFERTRLDTRNDRLRAEVIDLTTAVAECHSQVDVATARFRELAEEYAKEGKSPVLADRNQIYKALLSEHVWESYRRASSHAYAVLLLTEDTELARCIRSILDPLGKQRKLLTNMGDPAVHATAIEEYQKLRRAVDSACQRLFRFALLNLGVRVYASEGDHPISKLDIFKP